MKFHNFFYILIGCIFATFSTEAHGKKMSCYIEPPRAKDGEHGKSGYYEDGEHGQVGEYGKNRQDAGHGGNGGSSVHGNGGNGGDGGDSD